VDKLTLNEAAEMSQNVSTRFKNLEKEGVDFDENEIIDGLIFLLGQSVKLKMELDPAVRSRLAWHRENSDGGKETA
jgi:hypothetical protein